MNEITSIEGPVEQIDGKLTLLIPLDAGGDELIECTQRIGEVQGEDLKIVIPDWLADKLGLYEGCIVHVDNRDGKFNIWRVSQTQ